MAGNDSSHRRRKARVVPAKEFSIQREVDYIIARAAARDARMVRIASLVLFSTHSGDAWLLDPGDSLALWLARDGVPQPRRIVETETSFAIEWDRTYAIVGESFTTTDKNSRRTVTIRNYPVTEIRRTIAELER